MRVLARLRRPKTSDTPMAPTRQRALLKKLKRGDPRALEQIYDAHVDSLYSFVFYRVGRDSSLAEDVVQETFAKALKRLDDYDADRGSINSWLCTLSRNVIRDHLRAHRRAAELANMWERVDETLAQVFEALEQAPLSDEVLAREETRDLVNMTIANLPDHYRQALRQKYVEGDSVGELAKRLSVSEDAAKSLLARARRAFRETFSTLCHEMAEVK